MTKWHGFYSTPQVARLARVPVSTLYNWKKRAIIAPSVELVDENGRVVEEGYSYADLTIIKIIRALREDRLDLTSVGVALRHMYERLGPPSEGWSDAYVYIVGNKIFAEQSDDWQTTSATGFGQKVETRGVWRSVSLAPATGRRRLYPGSARLHCICRDRPQYHGRPACCTEYSSSYIFVPHLAR